MPCAGGSIHRHAALRERLAQILRGEQSWILDRNLLMSSRISDRDASPNLERAASRLALHDDAPRQCFRFLFATTGRPGAARARLDGGYTVVDTVVVGKRFQLDQSAVAGLLAGQ